MGVQRGDNAVIAALSSRLEDTYEVVRCAAAKSLAAIAETGDEIVTAALSGLLEDANVQVRRTALKSLAAVDPTVIAELSQRLQDGSEEVKCKALDAPAFMAEKGDPPT